ncbi:MAG: phosphoribosylaminoimidazolesuccinocarboxamide synthase [candidate division Zixibacteria bacterium]|nr:phosphoribosylaminoimidazolesuccinocarboxamide synthase [candidate division Zixibacteria bacterium]
MPNMSSNARIAVFISGSGSGLQSLIDASSERRLSGQISLVISNNADAYGLERAKMAYIPMCVIEYTQQSEADIAELLLKRLNESKISHIALAGFLKLLPKAVVREYSGRIVNIHPALLPKYGGKGMYGRKVHEAVLASGDKETGATIHLVDEEYDKGMILEQVKVPVLQNDTPETLAARVQAEEHRLYPLVIQKLITGQYQFRHGQILLNTNICEYPLFRRGKVRDIYDLGETYLFVATDRISAFDVVLPNGIPVKGKLLTQISLFWFDFLRDIVPNHVVSADINDFPAPLKRYSGQLEGRSMIVAKADRVDVECIVRGYLSGSLWKELVEARKHGKNNVHGFTFSPSMQESEILPEPIFSPSSKNDSGHDENISFETMISLVGEKTAGLCKEKSLAIYTKASEYALSRGIIIADTKFEFGFRNGEFILIDEALTPDSSRFWPVESYRVGSSVPSFDKQPIRDYLETLDWNKKPPGPSLPDAVIEAAAERYERALELLTGKKVNA